MLAVETGIAPNDLLDAPDGMVDEMFAYIKWRNDEHERRRPRGR